MITYNAGDIVPSEIDLTKRFLNRFQEVIPQVVEASDDEEEAEETEEMVSEPPFGSEQVMDPVPPPVVEKLPAEKIPGKKGKSSKK